MARAATASGRVATDRSSKQPGEPVTSRTSARPGEPATSRSSAEPDSRAELLEVLLHVDAEVKTMLHLSPRRATSRGMQASATVSVGRKV